MMDAMLSFFFLFFVSAKKLSMLSAARAPVTCSVVCHFVLLGLTYLSFWPSPAAAQTVSEKPNIVVINLDDADAEQFELSFSDVLFPNIMGVARQGITFDNLHVTTPLCGPSRACFYRGQYAHNTGIRVNNPVSEISHNFEGGFDRYKQKGYFESDLSTWMSDAGYRTMMVGKFLHEGITSLSVPKGWDDFYYSLGGRYYGTFRFTNRTSAVGTRTRIGLNEYRTNVEADDCVRLLQEHANRGNGQPFFLNVNPFGPHSAIPAEPEMVERSKANWWLRAQMPFSPAVNEFDTSDKRGHLGELPLMLESTLQFIDDQYRQRMLATRSVDDMVGRILGKIRQLGLEDSTYVFITSDNGFLLGHHRAFGKGLPSDRATRVPMIVKGPNVPQQGRGHHLLGHIDIAPTIVELAGGVVPEFVDGRSFARLLRPGGLDEFPQFRQALLIENWISLTQFGFRGYAASASVRTPDGIYTEWGNGDRDFFDLIDDPEQLENVYDRFSFQERRFYEVLLRSLKNPDKNAFATFAQPARRGQVVAAGAAMEGLAESAQGVREVRLAIYDPPANQYWNGTAWQNGFTQVSATIQNPNGQVTIWNYDSPPLDNLNAASQIYAWVWAYDNDFGTTEPSVASYRLDREGPSVSIASPDLNEVFEQTVTFQGTVFDDSEIREVRLFIRNRATNEFLFNGQFSAIPRPVVVRPNSSGTWFFETDLVPGDYGLNVRAFDVGNNGTEVPPWRHFEVVAP